MIKYSKTQSIGEIEETNPWREECWSFCNGLFYIVHWHNLKHRGFDSGPTPIHTWRFASSRYSLKIVVSVGWHHHDGSTTW